jgi:hypothetical protein
MQGSYTCISVKDNGISNNSWKKQGRKERKKAAAVAVVVVVVVVVVLAVGILAESDFSITRGGCASTGKWEETNS